MSRWDRFTRVIRTLDAHLYTSTSWWGCPPLPPHEELHDELVDPLRGLVPLRGHRYPASLISPEAPRRLRVLVHGLSSRPDARYLSPLILDGVAEKCDVISLALRGSIGEGCDHYHAGFTGDLQGLLKSPLCREYDEVTLIGCSLGGQVVLRYLCDAPDPRVIAGVALCPPIDLGETQRQLDRLGCRLYRMKLLASLKRAYRVIWENAQRAENPLPISLQYALASRSIYDWDERVVVPRFGFSSVEAYQREISISAEMLISSDIPTLLVFTRYDPIINLTALSSRLTEAVEHPESSLEMHIIERGGHLSFPRQVDLGVGASGSLASQLSSWFRRVSVSR